MKNKILNIKNKKYKLKIKYIFRNIFINLFALYFLLTNSILIPVFAQTATTSATVLKEESNNATSSATPTPQIQDQIDSISGKIIFDAPADDANPSAQIKIPTAIKKLSKNNFMADEAVTVTVENTVTGNTEIKLFDTDNRQVAIDTETVHNVDPTVIKILPPADFKPGRYTLKIKDPDGKESNQNFTWGVLAINTNKSLYFPDETAQLSIAVLNEKGTMVCDAKLTLDIKNPAGVSKILSTEDGTIIRNNECFIKDFTIKPDYEASYQTGAIGLYDMTLKAETKNGTYSITDSFEVREEIAFDIERQSATRIYPPKNYPMKISLTANQDFQGVIREIVPTDFNIASLEGALGFRETKIVRTSQAKNEITEEGISLAYPFTGNYELTADFSADVEDPLLKTKYNAAGLFGHDGLDYALPYGTPVIAVDDGVISYIGNEPYGLTVIIQHSWGRSYYGHLSETLVQTNDIVSVGDKIALTGSTGLSTGPHLHFGIRLNQYNPANGYYGKINPLPYLNSTSFVANPESVQIITWEVDLKKGDKINLGYNFRAPQESPELHLLGPLTLYQTNSDVILASEERARPESNNDSGVVPTESGLPRMTNIFQENRQWQIAADAISFSNLGSSADPDINSGADASSYSTIACSPGPCWTPPTSGLIIVFVYSRIANPGNVPTVSGNSLTWTQIDTVVADPGSSHRITLFGANASGSTQGQTTIDFAGQTQLDAMASFFQATGVDLSGGVAAAFVQTPDNNGTGTSGTVTLAAAGNSGNRPIAAFTHQENEVTTPDGAWTEVDDFNGGGPLRGFNTQWDTDGFQNASADWSPTSVPWVGMAAELKMESTGATLDQLMRHGGWFSSGVEQPFTF